MIWIATPVCLVHSQMQEICVDSDLVSLVGIYALIDKLSKYKHDVQLIRRDTYTEGISGITVLPSTDTRYERLTTTRTSIQRLYRYREYILESANRPSTPPSITTYERIYKYDASKVTIIGYIIVTLSTTIHVGRREEGGSVCISLPPKSRERREDIELAINNILSLMYKIIPTSTMSSIVSRWRLHIPNYRRLTWSDISLDLFRSSVLVDVVPGYRVYYVRSPHGTFLVDEWNKITSISDDKYRSIDIIYGTYDTTFHPIDMYVHDDIDVSSRPYEERISMIGMDIPTMLMRPSTPTDLYSFVIGRQSMIIFSNDSIYLWESTPTIRVYVGGSGTSLSLDDTDLTPINIGTFPGHIGEMIEVSGGKVIGTSTRPTPMSMSRINRLLSIEEDPISTDDLSGRTCKLYDKYVEKMMKYVYLYYRDMRATSIIDISNKIGHSYWATSTITTYSIGTSSKDIEKYVRESNGTIEGSSILGDDWQVDIVSSVADVPSTDALVIVRTIPTIDELSTYTAISISYVCMVVDHGTYERVRDSMERWGWTLDSNVPIDVDLPPLDPNCIVPLSIYMWKYKTMRAETVRLVYPPIHPGTISKIESPYGTLYRIGTSGPTTGSNDMSLLESIYIATSIQFRNMDKVAKILYILSHREPKIDVPLYLIPEDSWSMYQVVGNETLIYDYMTSRREGIVIFKNNRHWEPLAKKDVRGDLMYIW